MTEEEREGSAPKGCHGRNSQVLRRREGSYEIRIQGHLDSHWSEWFDGLTIAHEDDKTVLAGPIADQAALHGLLIKIRDLGLPLLSLEVIESQSIGRSAAARKRR